MNKSFLQIVILVFLFSAAYGQDNNAITKFVPRNYTIWQLVKGDLNLDSLEDVIVVLKKDGEDTLSTVEHPVKRIVLILTGQSDKSYTLIARNDNVVYFYNYDANFKDAFVDATIDGPGKFSINHYGGFARRWGRTSTFAYNRSSLNWFLVQDEFDTMNAADTREPNKTLSDEILTSENFGKISFDQFDIYKGRK